MNQLVNRDLALAGGQIIAGMDAPGVVAELTVRGADISGSHAEQIDRLLGLRALQLSTVLPSGVTIASLRAGELRTELAARNAPTQGVKQVLVAALLALRKLDLYLPDPAAHAPPPAPANVDAIILNPHALAFEASSISQIDGVFTRSDPIIRVPIANLLCCTLRLHPAFWVDNTCPLFGAPGRMFLSTASLLLTSACIVHQDAYDLGLGTTANLDELERISNSLGPLISGAVLPSRTDKIVEVFAQCVAMLPDNLKTMTRASFRPREVCKQEHVEAIGVCTLVNLGTWSSDVFQLLRFNVLNCITGCPNMSESRNVASLSPFVLALDNDFFGGTGFSPPGLSHLALNRASFLPFVKNNFLRGAIPIDIINPAPNNFEAYLHYRALDTSFFANATWAHNEILPIILPAFSHLVVFLTGSPERSYVGLLIALSQVLLPVSFWSRPLDNQLLASLNTELRNYSYILTRQNTFDLATSPSDSAALVLLGLITEEISKEKSLGHGRDRSADGHLSSSSSMSAISSSLSSGRDVNILVAAIEPILEAIMRTPNTEAGQVQALKLALRSESQWLFEAMVHLKSARVLAVYPAAAKINAVAKAQIPRMVALEILKTAGSVSPMATANLSQALGSVQLLGILEGSFPSLHIFAGYYASYVNAISIGSQTEIFSIGALTSDIGAFSAFIKFIMVLFAALGLNARDLDQLVSLATSLSLRLGSEHRSNVLRLNLTAALETSLANYGTSVKTWVKIPAVGPPPILTAALEKLIEARDAVEHFQSRDLSAFGFSNSSSVVLGPCNAQVQELPKPTPVVSSEKRKRDSSGFGSSGKKKVAFSLPTSGLGSPNPAQGSNVAESFASAECSGLGEVISWGGKFYPVKSLSAAWRAAHPKIPFRRDFIGALLCNSPNQDSFLARIPADVSPPVVTALQSFWASDTKLALAVSKPSGMEKADFRRAAGI